MLAGGWYLAFRRIRTTTTHQPCVRSSPNAIDDRSNWRGPAGFLSLHFHHPIPPCTSIAARPSVVPHGKRTRQAKGRSRHMDEWNVNDVVEWFQSIGHMQYEKSIREHQVGEEELGVGMPVLCDAPNSCRFASRCISQGKREGVDSSTDPRVCC